MIYYYYERFVISSCHMLIYSGNGMVCVGGFDCVGYGPYGRLHT
jgi:hypothetical protein